MIILAAVIILTLNNSGIINKANEAVELTDLAQVKHIATLKWSEAYLDKGYRKQEELEKYVLEELEKEVDLSNYKVRVTEKGVEVTINVPKKWRENVVDIVDTVPIPKGFVASGATGENTKAGGLVIYEGTEAVTDVNVETAKRTRNQYVWIPVSSEDFTTKFVRQNLGLSNTISNILGTNFWEVELDLTINTLLEEQSSTYVTDTTLSEVQKMYASVKEYEGFYVARYEAGIDVQRTKYLDENGNIILSSKLYSIMGKIPYTFIPWTKNNAMNEDTNGVVQEARNVYHVTNPKYGVASTLIYGVQWDTALQWWLDTNAVTSVKDSVNYGNYLDSKIISIDDLNEDALVWDYTISSTGTYVPKDSSTLAYPKKMERLGRYPQVH